MIHGNLWAQFRISQVLAERWKITREDMDEYSLESHRRAAEATDSGHFAREILPVPIKDENGGFTGETLTRGRGHTPRHDASRSSPRCHPRRAGSPTPRPTSPRATPHRRPTVRLRCSSRSDASPSASAFR